LRRTRKLPAQQVSLERKLIDGGESVPEVAKLFKVDRATIYRELQRTA
jgi:transposase